jgi:ParB family chromosome partitioning protein
MEKLEATGDCATCSFWKKKASPIKGKLIPGGTGKCTRPQGLCGNPKTKDPHPGSKMGAEKERGLRQQAPETPLTAYVNGSHEVSLTLIYPNPDQPRKFFPKDALEELALSIKEQGLIEPLVVVPRGEKFMLIAGERRWRACQIVGLEKVPVRIMEADDRQIAEMALVENLQRQNLTPLEEAKAFQDMLDRGYTKAELAQKLGFKQVWRVDERLSLLNLASKYQELMILGIISPSQAFEISRLRDHDDQEVVFRKIKMGDLPTYNHLRRFVNVMVESKKERTLFALPKKEDLEVVARWEKSLDAVTGLIVKSFSPDDCRVLATVMQGNVQVNIMKIDLIIKHLNMIKKAMLENSSRQEVVILSQEGG